MTERTWWEENGYLAGKPLSDDIWICVAPMLFTFRLMICTTDYVFDFYCYPSLARALEAFNAWTGRGDPLDGWVKHHGTGRRHPAEAEAETA